MLPTHLSIGSLLALFVLAASAPLAAQEATDGPQLVVQLGHSRAPGELGLDDSGRVLRSRALDVHGVPLEDRLWDVETGLLIGDETPPSLTFGASSEPLRPRIDSLGSAVVHTRGNTHYLSLGKRRRAFAAHQRPEIDRVAVGGTGGAKLWRLSTMEPVQDLVDERVIVRQLELSPDGRWLAAHCDLREAEQALVLVWDLASGALAHELDPQRNGFLSYPRLRFDASSTRLLTIDSAEAAIWDLASGERLATLRGVDARTQHRAWFDDPGGHLLLEQHGAITVWDGASDEPRLTMHCGAQGDTVASVQQRDRRVLLGSARGAVCLWDLEAGERVHELRVPTADAACDSAPFPCRVGALSLDDARVYAARGQRIDAWDLATGTHLRTLAPTRALTDAMLGPEGRRLFVGADDHYIVWDLDLARPIARLDLHAGSDTRLSRDGRLLAGVVLDDDHQPASIAVYDTDSGALAQRFELEDGAGRPALWFTADQRHLVAGFDGGGLVVWQLDSAERVYTSPHFAFVAHRATVSLARSPDGRMLASADLDGTIYLHDLETRKVAQRLDAARHLERDEEPLITGLTFTDDGERLVAEVAHARQLTWSVADGRYRGEPDEPLRFESFNDALRVSWKHTPRGRQATRDGAVVHVDVRETGRRVTFAHLDDAWLAVTDAGDFTASPQGDRAVAMVLDTQPFALDQFALVNNRPDRVLAALASPDTALIEHFEAQHAQRSAKFQRRLVEAGFDAQTLPEPSFELHVPSVDIEALRQDGRQLTLDARVHDARYELAFVQVYADDVPLYPGFGRPLERGARELTLSETVTLLPGVNRIELSAVNVNGAESWRALRLVAWEPQETPRGALYVVSFGVSDYADDTLDLAFAHKDSHDLVKLLAASDAFDAVHSLSFTDAQVTRERIADAARLLADSAVDDTVVLHIAGHGLHARDSEASYYFLTHDTDLERLPETAAPFAHVEALLAAIPARRKLFLMDTCESGEMPEASVRSLDTLGEGEQTTARGLRLGGALALTPAGDGAPLRSWLHARDRYIYNDLARRTGAVVLSSSRGGEFSFESRALGNGYFTAAVLAALTDQARDADGDGDGWLDDHELRTHVARAVAERSQGLQNPTVDRDNLRLRVRLPIVGHVGTASVSTLPLPANAAIPGPAAQAAQAQPLAAGDPAAGGCACALVVAPSSSRSGLAGLVLVMLGLLSARRRRG